MSNSRNSLTHSQVQGLTSNASNIDLNGLNDLNDPNVRAIGPVGAAAPSPADPPARVRKKPGRKPKSFYLSQEANQENSASNTDAAAPKQKRTRKPRDPNAPKQERKKKRTVSTAAGTTSDLPPGPDQRAVSARAPETVGSFFMHPAAVAAPGGEVNPSENGRRDPIPTQNPNASGSFFNPDAAPQTHHHSPPQTQLHPQQPRTSGQNYDPIRSNYDPVRETVVSHNPFSNPQGAQGSPHLPQTMNRASASPSISSLVDPPNQALTSPSIATQSFFNQQQARLYQNDGPSSHPPSPTVIRLAPSAPAEVPSQKQPMPPRKSDGPSLSKKASLGHGSTATSSAAASPKPPKPKNAIDVYPAPPPLPGSGLMHLGGIGNGGEDGTEFRAPTVILHIPMNGEANKIINFTRMAEEQYGWDALHPRLAAQRDRLARVAAAGAALERNGSSKDSGDDMSLDSEGEASNVEMGGMSDGRTGTDGGAKKIPRKRRMKEDQYDKDDGFVDDSELLWEEQAAAAQDGFFVYSGPLVPEGEKPALDPRSVLPNPIPNLVTNDITEQPAPLSVAEEEEAEEDVGELLVVVQPRQQQQQQVAASESTLAPVFLSLDLAREEDPRPANHGLLKLIGHVWIRRSWRGRRWGVWRVCRRGIMAAWCSWLVMLGLGIRPWFLISRGFSMLGTFEEAALFFLFDIFLGSRLFLNSA